MSRQKLYIILIDQYQQKIFEGYIAHIDSCQSYTICYLSEHICEESKIVRLIETLQTIKITSESVNIYYQSGAELQIIRKNA